MFLKTSLFLLFLNIGAWPLWVKIVLGVVLLAFILAVLALALLIMAIASPYDEEESPYKDPHS